MSPKFVLTGITKEDYENAGSKFVDVGFDLNNQIEAAKHIGESFFFPIECQALDWDTQGTSMKIDTLVTDGINKGHEEKVSFGVDKKGIWKGKALYKNITGGEMPFEKIKGVEYPAPDSEQIEGKKGMGMWTITKGENQATKTPTYYPKLMDILPADYKPGKKDLGI
jgi:hypothetical protein